MPLTFRIYTFDRISSCRIASSFDITEFMVNRDSAAPLLASGIIMPAGDGTDKRRTRT
jgi:hypothetical protein